MKQFTLRLFLPLLATLFVGLSPLMAEEKKQKAPTEDKTEQGLSEEVSKLIKYGKELLGRRYRSRGPGGVMLDCSGFVGYVFSKLNIALPRCSRDMARTTRRIDKSKVRPGDLLYFAGRALRGGVGHVGMVIDVKGEDITMIHSSTSRGVVVERYNRSAYFARRFLSAGRVEALEQLISARTTPAEEQE